MNWRVPLADLEYGEGEETAIVNVLRNKWLTMGAITQEFEAQFCQTIGAKHAIACSNATEALHLACLVLGVGFGSEVITPSLSFVATSNAVLYTGAEVRFADILGQDDLTIDPDDIIKNVTHRTKAIMVMHYAGYPCHMHEIIALAKRLDLPVIEDAAHAPGATLDGKSMGTWGTIGCFSFFSNKNIATGEGGMLVTDRDDVAEKVRLLRSHGMTSLTYDRHQGHAYSYDVVDLGYNYRIDEIRSALGIEQLKKMADNNALRKTWTERYWKSLNGIGVGLPFEGKAGSSACHIFPILLPPSIERKAFIDRLRVEGIQTSIHYPPTHRFSYYKARYGSISLPRTEYVSEHEVTLPLYPSMGAERVDLVSEVVARTVVSMQDKSKDNLS
jgi:dTDP-4-amino-4,6-dideoxygalactose transaminase